MAYKDKEKRNEYNRNWLREKYKNDPEFKKRRLLATKKWKQEKYKNDPEWVRNRNAQEAQTKKKYLKKVADLLDIFFKNGCKSCEETDRVCLCAHHSNPKIKKFQISSVGSIKHTRETLKKELAKCICLCANCHAKLHAKQRRLKKKQEINSGKKL